MNNVGYLEDSDFDQNGSIINPEILSMKMPVVVMMQASWCPHCKSAIPAFDEFAGLSQGKVFSATIQSDGDRESEKALGKLIKETIMNHGKEFERYAMLDKGISSMNMHYYKHQIESSMTPYILEERQLRATQMDIFSRLMRDRLLWVAGGVDDRMSTVVQAQLMYLDSSDKTDITMHIDSPGGSVKSGLSMVDVMNYISCDIRTVNTGMAASMGSILLGAGTKGKRSSLRFSRTMLHQSSGGAGGNIQDARISFIEWEKINNTLFELLGEYCGKDADQVKNDASRDLWLDSQQALDYGIIDEIVKTKKKGK